MRDREEWLSDRHSKALDTLSFAYDWIEAELDHYKNVHDDVLLRAYNEMLKHLGLPEETL